jgi:hypothetical protein
MWQHAGERIYVDLVRLRLKTALWRNKLERHELPFEQLEDLLSVMVAEQSRGRPEAESWTVETGCNTQPGTSRPR